MKIFALYLPQYHEIMENDEWWGQGYTEWDSLKQGEVLLEGQYQPRIPLGANYYNLLDEENRTMRWQVEIAKKHGVYGFCVYHYWFNGKLLLERPMENYLNDSSIDFPFFFCWANENWTDVWSGNTEKLRILISHDYSKKQDWIDHFNYFSPFFKDKRYLKQENKPIICIYNPVSIEYRYLSGMIKLWNEMARECGYDGVIMTFQCAESMQFLSRRDKKLFDYQMEYNPSLQYWRHSNKMSGKTKYLREKLSRVKILREVKTALVKKKNVDTECASNRISIVQDYDEVWKEINEFTPQERNIIPGAFVDWDNTPRRKYNGKLIVGATPAKFKEYLVKTINRARDTYNKDAIIVFAWNEWSEGGYLEPDEKWRYGYLESISAALHETNEWPTYKEKSVFERD